MDRLDEKDRRLLEALKKNARASLVSLARDIDLSRSATHDRITRLEERGIIERYTIIQKNAGQAKIRAFLTVLLDAETRDTTISPLIASKPGVTGSHCLAGDIDILVECACETMDALSALREDIAAIKGIKSVHTRLILNSQ